MEHYFAREPAPIERLEVAVAGLTAIFAAVHKEKGSPQPKITDFLPYLKAWSDSAGGGRYNEIDKEIMKVML